MARVLDARAGQDIVRVRGHGVGQHWGVRAVQAADGTTTECDLLVTATGWTAPAALLSMAGDRPGYDPRAARFFPRQLPDDVLATGGIAGDGSHDELIAHAPRWAARRPAGRPDPPGAPGGRADPAPPTARPERRRRP